MKPPQQDRKFEKIPTNDFVSAIIEEIQYEQEHEFTFKGTINKAPGVKFKFIIEGCEYPHSSRWMKFIYAAKANLYQKYIVPLVEGAKPFMDFDMDQLKGMKVKMLWVDNGEYQNIETIRPADGKKIVPLNQAV
jgi:hypothetical protein